MKKKVSKHTTEESKTAVAQEAVKKSADFAATIKELESQLHEVNEQAEKLKDEVMRKAADFENFRRQKERETQMASARTLEKTIKELLPVVDDISRIVEHAPEVLEKSEEARPYVDGVKLLQKNFMKWLSDKGVSRIEALGKKMDVNFHEAITQVDNPDAEPETIIEEYQAGYVLGDRVLRHSKVVVAK